MDPAAPVNTAGNIPCPLAISITSVVRMHNSSETHPRHGNSELTWIARRAGEFTSPDADAADAACPIRIMKPRTCGISRTALRLLHRANSKFLVHFPLPIPLPVWRTVQNSPPSIWHSPEYIDPRAFDRIRCTYVYRERHHTIVK